MRKGAGETRRMVVLKTEDKERERGKKEKGVFLVGGQKSNS